MIRTHFTRSLVAASLVALAGSAAAATDPGLKAGTYTIDATHTYGNFEVDHMGLSTMHGRIDVKSGTIQIDPDNAASNHVMVTLDPASVDTGDTKRDEHLRDMDGFFDVKKYPDMTFKSTSVSFDDDTDEATVKGNLTLHGVTRPVTLDVEDMACHVNPLEKSNYTCGFSAETMIKRSDFGMDAYLPMVGDEIELSIEVEANKPVDSKS